MHDPVDPKSPSSSPDPDEPQLPRFSSIVLPETKIIELDNADPVDSAVTIDQPKFARSEPVSDSATSAVSAASQVFKQIGRYVIQSELGKGGFGTVLLAFDATLQRKVAIKVPRLDVSKKNVEQEFLAEARQLAQLNHPGIVGVLDVVTENGRCFIVSDFVDGMSLSQWIKENQPDWKQSVQICALIADALGHAHAQRTVHRDLKPANVIMTSDNQPVIVDFGLAVSDIGRATGTMRGEISGTPGYMSPEQAYGAGHRIDGRTDIYSLGVILYRLITGRAPFEATSVLELMRQVQEDEPQPPRQLNRDLPAELERICLKAMAKRLKDRYTTADDLAHDLRLLIGVSPIKVSNVSKNLTPTPRPSPEVAGRKTMVGIESLTEPKLPQLVREGQWPDAVPVLLPDFSKVLPSDSRRRAITQRRQVTIVLCGCDVFENDLIVETLDSDEQAAILKSFQSFCHELAEELGGSILQDTDDGVAICFGFPRVFEDSVSRAARFGLAVINRMPAFNQQLFREVGFQPAVKGKSAGWKPTTLTSRIVMHTDVAVVEAQQTGEDSSQSSVSVVGNVRNFTTRLESLAELGCVIVSDSTHRLLKGRFHSLPMGEHRVKGLPTSVTLHRLESERMGGSRVDLADPAGLTPLIGRDREVGLLQDRWEQAAEGMGQVVLIIGEAGLGKSRLVHALKRHVLDHADSSRDPIIEWRASQQRQNSSLYPTIECFERVLGFERDDSVNVQLDKLIAHLRGLNLDGDVEIALMASLLSIPLGGTVPELKLPPQMQREQTTQLLLDWLKEMSQQQALLFIIEDLHWVDPSTLEFVELLVDRGLNDRILTLLTFRPEFETPWKSKAHQTNLALNRLTKRQIQELMERKAARRLPASVVDQIIERTEGVPLFVEEYTQMIVESDAFSNDPDSSISGVQAIKQIPASLQDMLMSRLDRIDCDLAVLQLAASIGRTFSIELINACVADRDSQSDAPKRLLELSDQDLQAELDKLTAAELLFVQGRVPRQRYQFKHALLQDAAYNSLIKAKRQEFHARIAWAYETCFPDVCEKEPEVIAQHFTDANIPDKASEFWQRAGERSLQRYAYREAIQQIRAGLEIIKAAPESRERHLREIELHVMLGVPLQSIAGYSAPEVEENYARAYALCQELKLTIELFPILYGLFRYYMLQGKYAKAVEISEQLVEMAREYPEPDFVVAAHRAIASPLVYQGRYAEALPHLAKVLSIDATPEIRAKVNRYDVVDPWIAAGSYASWALWLTGYPQQALERSQKTLSEAEALKHPFTLTLALSFSTWLHQFRRDVAATLSAAERALALAEEHGFRFWIGWGNVLKHWALGISGRDPNACEAIRQGIVTWRAQGSELGSSYFYALQADVALALMRPTEAAAALGQAEDFARATSEGFPLPDLHRLRGEVSLRLNDALAESHFQMAIDTAKHQGSRSLELRATTSLARHLQDTRRLIAARDVLDAVLCRFSEGADTSDLQDAFQLRNILNATAFGS